MPTSDVILVHAGWRWRGPHGGWIYDDKRPVWPAEAFYVFEEKPVHFRKPDEERE